MLTVAKITASQAVGYSDYLEGKTQASSAGDYYLKDGQRVEAPGRWVQGASRVGADAGQPVEAEHLRDLMAVRFPGTERPLRRIGGNGESVAAIDATFSAPKSVSVAWAVADEELREAIEAAHEAAVDSAMRYALRYALMIRERVDDSTVIHGRASEMIATSWRHSTARAVGNRLPDPQLHSHVLLHGALRENGRVAAIDSRIWLVHRREIGAAYRSELARELGELGFEIQRHTGRSGRYFELAGVPQELMDRWSGRHHQIRELIDANLRTRRIELEQRIADGGSGVPVARAQLKRINDGGQLDAATDRLLGVSSRTAKNVAITEQELDRSWGAEAAEFGFDLQRLRSLQRAEPVGLSTVSQADVTNYLTEFEATFVVRDARAVALEQLAGAPIEDTVGTLRELWLAGEIFLLTDGTMTTDQQRHREFETVNAAVRLVENGSDALSTNHVRAAVASVNARLGKNGGFLSVEQHKALELGTGQHQIVMIEGQAGTGKSTVLQAIGLAHQAAGRDIIVTSTAALAAQRLAADLQEAGIATVSYSTAGLHRAIVNGQLALDPESTVIHDEAALASTLEHDQLLAAIEESGARLILVGDAEQSQPVGAGGLWPLLRSTLQEGEATTELSTNLRARDPADRRDQKLFREHDYAAAIDGYASRDRVHLTPILSEAEDQALLAAHHDRQAGVDTIVIAQTSNDHLDELNARAQALRSQDGELGLKSIPVPGHPYDLHTGDRVQIRHTLNHPDHGQLRNGTTATIGYVDPYEGRLDLRLSDDADITLSSDQMQAADLRLSYVQHPFPAQGVTTDTAHLIVGEHASREGSYVAITRPRYEAHIYASDDLVAGADGVSALVQLAERMGRDEREHASITVSRVNQIEPSRPQIAAPTTAWHAAFVTAPTDPAERENWAVARKAVATYRQRYEIPQSEPSLLGLLTAPSSFAQRSELRKALNAARPWLTKDAISALSAPERGVERGARRAAD